MLPRLPSFLLPVPDEHMVVQGGCRPLHPETEDLVPKFRLLVPQLLDREVLDLLLLHDRLMPPSKGTSSSGGACARRGERPPSRSPRPPPRFHRARDPGAPRKPTLRAPLFPCPCGFPRASW